MESVFANWFFFCAGVFLCLLLSVMILWLRAVFLSIRGYRQLG